jgi:hypothetical protein
MGRLPMYIETLDTMAGEGIKMTPFSEVSLVDDDPTTMNTFLQAVAVARNITGQDIASWVTKVQGKLHSVGITTVKEAVSRIVMLNHDLRAAKLSVMHRQTIDLMAKKGVKTLLPLSVMPKQSSLLDPDLLASSDVPVTSTVPPPGNVLEMGQCLACDGFGPLQTLCSTCTDGGLSYKRIKSSNKSNARHLNGCARL